MQKKRKSIFTAVVTALFVLSVSYFALLAPTTAWYYQETVPNDYNYSFKFRNFNESFAETIGGTAQNPLEIPLRAATRFADTGEWLFDEVAYVIHLTTTNEAGSDLMGIVRVNVTNLPTGVLWYAFGTDTPLTGQNLTTPVPGTTKGTYKDKLETMLGSLGVQTQSYADIGETLYENGTEPDGVVSAYNYKAKIALSATHQEGVLVPKGATRYIHIVFWAEYGSLKTALQSANAGVGSLNASVLSNTTATINVTAEPYLGNYSTRTYSLRLYNTSPAPIDATIALEGENERTVTVPANTTVVESIKQDTQLRVSIDSGKYFHKDQGTPGMLCGDTYNVWVVGKMSDGFELSLS